MLLSAGGRAGVVTVAALLALVAPFLADKVWEGEGVLGHVGLEVVAADTAVGQGFLSRLLLAQSSDGRKGGVCGSLPSRSRL